MNTTLRAHSLPGAALAAALAGTPAYGRQPTCIPSKHGPDDQIGDLNYVTPEKTLAASKLVTTGKAYRLGIETNKNTPAYPPRTFSLIVLQPGQVAGGRLGKNRATYNDDIIAGWVGVGSQIDGLGHVGIDSVYYNCLRAADFVQTDGLAKLGVENIPPIATRGVLLDIAGDLGVDIIREGTAINRAEIEGAMKRQGLTAITRGDVVLFHTGWAKLIGEDDARYNAAEPGLGAEGARYLIAIR